jgi:hypothetical protein
MGLRQDVEREWLEREQRIVRYCAGRLSADDEEAFEAELLDDTELAADVQLAMVLRDGLQEANSMAAPRSERPPALRSPWLALAAGVVLGAVGLSIVRGPGNGERVFADVEYLTLGVVRSAEPQLAPVTSSIGAQSLLIIEVPAEQSTRQIELIRPDGRREQMTGTRDQGYLRIALAPPVDTGGYVAVSGQVRYEFSVESRVQ